jgi:arylsulfatase A-like enzyme
LVRDGAAIVAGAKACAAAGAVAALLCLPLLLVVAWVWGDPRLGGRLRSCVANDVERSMALVIGGAFALIGLSSTTLGGMAIFEMLFASKSVQQLAVLGSVPVLALVMWMVCGALVQPLEHGLNRVGRTAAVVVSVAVVLAMGLAWAALIGQRFSSVFDQLAIRQYLSFPAVLLGGSVGALLGSGKGVLGQTVVRYGWIPASLLVVIASAYALGTPPKNLKLVLGQQGSGAGFVLGLVSQAQKPVATGVELEGVSAVCKPGQRQPKASDVGTVGDEAPDVILVTVDAMRWDHMPMSGYSRKTMPQLEKHARDGAVFEQAYATASSTRQTFRSAFSGIYSSRVEAPKSTRWGVSFSEEQETIASFLNAAGVQTIALSSDPGAFPKKYGAFRGFEVIDESATAVHDPQDYSAPYKIDRIIAHLSNLDDDRPKFVWTHLSEPHQPYAGGPDPKRWGKKESDRYDTALRFVDGELDRLLDFARGPARRRRTIVIIAADHGQAFREHGNRFHGGTVYQEEVHVPLIFWGPDIEAGSYETPVSLIDLLPTTLDLLGLKIPQALCGVSLEPTLREGIGPDERPIYVEAIPDSTRDYFAVALIRGTYKVVVRPADETIELFDLAEDPDEKNDIADTEPERLKEHLQVFRAFYREHGLDPADYGLGTPK